MGIGLQSYSSEEVFFLNDGQGNRSTSPFAVMGHELQRHAPLTSDKFHDRHYCRVLGALFANPSPDVRHAVEFTLDKLLWGSGSKGFVAVHLRWSESTCALRINRPHHHPAVLPEKRGLGSADHN